MSTESVALRWHAGWAAVRGLASVTERDGVVVTAVGDAHREVELLVPEAEADPRRLDRACQRTLAERDAWVAAVTRDPARTGDRLGEHGLRVVAASECLMRTDLADQADRADRVLPDGLHLREDAGDVSVRWRVETDDAVLAASGQASYVDGWCVPDKIEVDPDFRRRGLGGAVMGALADAARARSATRGVLVASPEGRLLYASLGWERVADLVVGAHS